MTFLLHVQNAGNRPAFDCRIRTTPDFDLDSTLQSGTTTKQIEIIKAVFDPSGNIPVIAPGGEVHAPFGSTGGSEAEWSYGTAIPIAIKYHRYPKGAMLNETFKENQTIHIREYEWFTGFSSSVTKTSTTYR